MVLTWIYARYFVVTAWLYDSGIDLAVLLLTI
jgi:hypothetical protein